ncbi:MAG: radical SAM protein [Polyangiaceae bacterium]|nr:radical SAM protein [Polyangiaceae bacterium]
MRTLSVAFVLPLGEPSEAFFPDTLLAELCAGARDAGHRAEVLRVYYDGRDRNKDAAVAARFERWLGERDVDVVVVERLFDPDPIRAHASRDPRRRCVLISRGDSFEPSFGVDLVVGAAGVTRTGTRRTPNNADIALAMRRVLERIAEGRDAADVAGVGKTPGAAPVSAIEAARARLPYRAVVEQAVISLDEPPPVRRKALFGNVGCPYAADPLERAHYRGLRLPSDGSVARLGCGFCSLGGDYEKRPDAEVIDALVEQASFWTSACPGVEELQLTDQHSLRYLAALVRRAQAQGVRPVRWLFAARPDSFVRERSRVEDAVRAAAAGGHAVECYLSGFEAFSDEELERYNKGVTVADLVAAVHRMRELARSWPAAFGYARTKGHSLILWNPWTTPETLGDSVATLREHGLCELFHEVGRNRLRLYPDLPLYYAAERDGALVSQWEAGDEGAARRKGYSAEHPWRFLDARTRLAHGLALALRDRLGPETELGQLRAVLDFVALDRAPPASTERDVLEGVDALDRVLSVSCGGSVRGALVSFAGRCNNGCTACPNKDHWLDDDIAALRARLDAARAHGTAIVLAGREPTLHPAFIELVARARGDDGRPVAVVSNGRRFAYPGFARASVRAGLSAASIKLFGVDAPPADEVAREPGAHAQALAGLRSLHRAGIGTLEVRAPLHRSNLDAYEWFADLAETAGVHRIRVECALDAVGLVNLARAAGAVEELRARCAQKGVALVASPLRAGTRLFDAVQPGLARAM